MHQVCSSGLHFNAAKYCFRIQAGIHGDRSQSIYIDRFWLVCTGQEFNSHCLSWAVACHRALARMTGCFANEKWVAFKSHRSVSLRRDFSTELLEDFFCSAARVPTSTRDQNELFLCVRNVLCRTDLLHLVWTFFYWTCFPGGRNFEFFYYELTVPCREWCFRL